MERAYENKGPVIIYRLAGSGGFGAKLRWNLADPPFECYFTEVPPPPPPQERLMTFAIPYHVFIFQANLSGPPSESFQSFERFPLLGSQ